MLNISVSVIPIEDCGSGLVNDTDFVCIKVCVIGMT